MAVGIYLLDLHPGTDEERQVFLQKAAECVDPVRRRKAEHLKSEGARAASLGAGLLLQKMVLDQQNGIEVSGCIRLEAGTLFSLLKDETPLPLSYAYGEQGKPELTNFPKHFNLSHSGDYVICAVSDGEVGADIQKWIPFRERTAERFFAAEEWKELQELPESLRTEHFYRLWTRKEAYGKYTGRGIGSTVSENVSGEEECMKKQIRFLEMTLEDGYSIAVCCKRER